MVFFCSFAVFIETHRWNFTKSYNSLIFYLNSVKSNIYNTIQKASLFKYVTRVKIKWQSRQLTESGISVILFETSRQLTSDLFKPFDFADENILNKLSD